MSHPALELLSAYPPVHRKMKEMRHTVIVDQPLGRCCMLLQIASHSVPGVGLPNVSRCNLVNQNEITSFSVAHRRVLPLS